MLPDIARSSRRVLCSLGMITVFVFTCRGDAELKQDLQMARRQMVEDQIIARGVTDQAVIDAMLTVERHKFVPENLTSYAYTDQPLPIGSGQTISQPYIVALMTELLNVGRADTVLEIGTGSGYQAAVLSRIVSHVYTIEIVGSLAAEAKRRLQELGYDNITVKTGDGYEGWPEYAGFDGIIITAAPPKIPQPLLDQMSLGGTMVVPVGDAFQELQVITRQETGYHKERSIPVRFVPMVGKIQEY